MAADLRLPGAMLVAVVAVVLLAPRAAGQTTDYIVGPQDVLTIQVFDQPDLGGSYSVEADGTIAFPLIGRVRVSGLALRDVEALLRTKLSDGFFKNPQVSAAVQHYRSQRIFIVGEVKNPGTYPLTGDMTLIEALARSGAATAAAGGEAIVVRPRNGSRPASGPVLPQQQEDTDVTRVDINALQSGKLSQNISLRDGDTIFVPRAEQVFVLGEVRNPGAFPVQKDTTVLQALALAGGVTERGAMNRLRVVRIQNGKKVEIKVNGDDVIRPGDTLIVPERFF